MKMLVNCALPYANNSIHLGHVAGAYLGADIFVRYNRMIGNTVLFVSGSDEFGTAITIQADRENTTPKAIADRFHNENKKSFSDLDIDFDIFSRTSEPEHEKNAQEIFLEVLKSGYLYTREMVSPYCVTCGKFMPDRYITGTCPNCGYEEARGDQCDNCGKVLDPQDLKDPKCAISGDAPEFRETTHFFLKLSAFGDDLLAWISKKEFWKKNVLDFTRNFIEGGLEDRPVTRDLNWGVRIPVEGFEDKRIYVWFENVLGYISASKIYSTSVGKPDYWKEFWDDPESRIYYFIGKDNIPFHTVIFPAILMALGRYNLPYDVPANEFLNFGGKKFSKSRGIGFRVKDILKVVDKDYLRYYLASVMPENGDSDFNIDDLEERVNTEFISKYGNLVHRVTSFITKNELEISPTHDDEYSSVMEYCSERLNEYRKHLDSVEFKKALHEWIDLVQYGNAFMNRSAPWKLIKTDREKCISKLYATLKIIEYATSMIFPFTPSSAEKVWSVLGLEGSVKDSILDLESDSQFKPEKTDPLFQKVEIEDPNVNSLDLRVAKILEVREHPNADKLYLLRLKIGQEERQLVAGLRKHYSREELEGRKIIVICNLKPAKIRGEISNGMLLAADDGNNVRFLTVDDATEDGQVLTLGELPYNESGTLEIDDLAKFNLKISNSDGHPVATATVEGTVYTITYGKNPAFPERAIADGSRIR